VGTRELLAGTPLSEVYAWMQLLGAYDLIMSAAGIALFDALLAD
jgi:hypothetical protein